MLDVCPFLILDTTSKADGDGCDGMYLRLQGVWEEPTVCLSTATKSYLEVIRR
jgi:hypothetical protein